MRSVILTLGMMAAQGTVLAAIALVLSRLGRLRPAWQALVWLVVLIKLSIPWGPALPWSLSDIIAMLTEHGAPPPSPLPPALQGPVPGMQPSGVWTLLVIVWAVGAAFVIVRAVVAQAIAVGVARRATLLETIGRTQVLIGPPSSGPHVVGVFRPRIIVPPSLVADPAMLRAALFHELAHVQRRDSLARVLEVWASAVMWWNPVARFVLRRLDAAREAACDAYALDHGIERPAYARLLLQMATLRAPQPALAVPHSLDRRVAAVLAHQKRPRRIGIAHAIVLLAFAVVALGGARSAAAHGRPACMYSPQMAQALYVSHPEFDLDGDGTLSRDEACGLQAELRHQKEVLASPLDPEAETLLSEPLCCNCDEGGAYSTPATASCQNQE
ncbi:MAG: M56 family metallopeptidase [Deltaproteobacteria bacterium]|nr:M56 family metallopeptidase [Deltaproteobacteria bacterium]